MRHHRALHWALSLLAAILATVALTQLPSNTPTPASVRVVASQSATRAVERAAAQAGAQLANQAPPANQVCVVPSGEGVMGACAPKVTIRLAGAASVQTVHGKIGVDTSSFQGCQVAPAWLSFWIVKATEGTGYRDRCTAKNVADAKRQHQVYGTYDFMRATGSSAAAEASTYVAYARATGAARGLHVLDVEANSRGLSASTLHSYICDWVSRVHNALGGPVVIYTGNWFWSPQVGGSTCGAILWDSAYASYAQLPGTWGGGFLSYYGWAPYVGQRGRYRALTPLWQYGDGVNGPGPRVNRWDTDAFFGTRAQLEQLANLAPKVKPCSKRTACRMGRRHAHVHQTIARKCNPAANRKRHARICLKLHNRNEYMHRYARGHHITFVVR